MSCLRLEFDWGMLSPALQLTLSADVPYTCRVKENGMSMTNYRLLCISFIYSDALHHNAYKQYWNHVETTHGA